MDEISIDIEAQAAAPPAEATWETLELRRTIARAQDELAALDLQPEARKRVVDSLNAAGQEAGHPRPDRYCVAMHLGAAAQALDEMGALVAGTNIVEALRRARELLGPVGAAEIGAL
jgi:hypothetical protein